MKKKHVLEWIEKYGELTKKICEENRVPYQLCWAQAMLESGKGTNILAQNYNLWGVKYREKYHKRYVKKWSPEIVRDKETGKWKKIKLKSKFAAWDSLEEGIRGWVQYISRPRYRHDKLWLICMDPLRYVTWLWARGYATSRKYVKKWVKRLQRIYEITGNEDFNQKLDIELEILVDALMKKDFKDRRELIEVFLDKEILIVS